MSSKNCNTDMHLGRGFSSLLFGSTLENTYAHLGKPRIIQEQLVYIDVNRTRPSLVLHYDYIIDLELMLYDIQGQGWRLVEFSTNDERLTWHGQRINNQPYKQVLALLDSNGVLLKDIVDLGDGDSCWHFSQGLTLQCSHDHFYLAEWSIITQPVPDEAIPWPETTE